MYLYRSYSELQNDTCTYVTPGYIEVLLYTLCYTHLFIEGEKVLCLMVVLFKGVVACH